MTMRKHNQPVWFKDIGENPQLMNLNEQLFTTCQFARELELNMSLRSKGVALLWVKKKKQEKL